MVKKRVFYESLQIIRALAALIVVIGHLGVSFVNPDFGVYVFFMLSGVVMAMLSEDKNQSHFIVRRLIRVWPLYFLSTTVLFVVLIVLGKDIGIGSAWTAYLKSILFIPYQLANGMIVPLLPPGWSLNLEIFFYGLIGIFITLGSRYVLWGTSSILVILIVIGLLNGIEGVGRFYCRPLLMYFLVGMAVWKIRPSYDRFSKGMFYGTIFFTTLSISLFDFFITFESELYVGQNNWLKLISSSLSGALLLWVALGTSFSGSQNLLTNILIRIGNESYSLYLTHMYVVYIALTFLPLSERSITLQFFVVVLGVISSLILSSFVHKYLDVPAQSILKIKFIDFKS
jgi:peptidoglycan/LPS O-acetylase OafA/YrhL